MILNELADAVAIGKTMTAVRQEAPQRPKRIRSKRPVMARASEGKPEATSEVEQKPVEIADTPSQENPAEQQETK